jgi:hypothetical protein
MSNPENDDMASMLYESFIAISQKPEQIFRSDYSQLKKEALLSESLSVGPLRRMVKLLGTIQIRAIFSDFAPVSNSDHRIIIRKRMNKELGEHGAQFEKNFGIEQRYKNLATITSQKMSNGMPQANALVEAATELQMGSDLRTLQRKLADYRKLPQPMFEIDHDYRKIVQHNELKFKKT